MEVTLLYFDDCPNWKITDDRLLQLADEFDGMTIRRQFVGTPEEAEQYGFRGSPSVLVDGVDPFATEADPIGMSCRMYITPDGLAGSPTVGQLREVLDQYRR